MVVVEIFLLLMMSIILSWIISLYYHGNENRFLSTDVHERITPTAWLFFVITTIGELIWILIVL